MNLTQNYSLVLNENNEYVDADPWSITYPLRCPCGSKKDKIFNTPESLVAHFRCKAHRSWIYTENYMYNMCGMSSAELGKNQKIVENHNNSVDILVKEFAKSEELNKFEEPSELIKNREIIQKQEILLENLNQEIEKLKKMNTSMNERNVELNDLTKSQKEVIINQEKEITRLQIIMSYVEDKLMKCEQKNSSSWYLA